MVIDGSIIEQSAERNKILADIESSRKAVYSKKKQISSARGRTKFPGVRIQDQFSVGRLGVEPFRARRKVERKIAFDDLGMFSGQLPALNANLASRKQALIDFDALPKLEL